jgi:hypothetical protein
VVEKLKDNWEDILQVSKKSLCVSYYLALTNDCNHQEMDTKWVSFAREKYLSDNGLVGDDLLAMLLLGTWSTEMETFLLQTMGERGLKKAQSFVDGSYRKLLDLLSLHMNSAAISLVHHCSQLLNELKSTVDNNNRCVCVEQR